MTRSRPARSGSSLLLSLCLLTAFSLLLAPGVVLPAQPAAATTANRPKLPRHVKKSEKPAHTSALEARRVDRVPTPKLRWYGCGSGVQCATVRLPLDYDRPHGATVELALTRVRARDRSHKLGTLFVNPGGPGGSASDLAASAHEFLSSSVTRRFDVVGVDPRGTNYSDQVRCFSSPRTQLPVVNPLQDIAFPYGRSQERTYVKAAEKLGRACSTRGRPLSASMSTAQVARDMDVLRRAVGDRKLNYLGFSYGSFLGEVYADLFPDRIRTVAIDGIIEPRGWIGSKKTRSTPLDARLGTAAGSWKAMKELLVLCDRAGTSYCPYAAGNPLKNFERLLASAKKKPLTFEDPFSGEELQLGYSDLVSIMASSLYSDVAPEDIAFLLSELTELATADRSGKSSSRRSDRAARAVARHLRDLREVLSAPGRADDRSDSRSAYGFPYDNSLEAYSTVLCTDGLHPSTAQSFVAQGAKADKSAPYFGRFWTWSSAACASRTWTARDEDADRGSFTRRTSARLLVVGSYWDPATSYVSAQKTAKLMPNSRLLSSDNWGHTAYGTSSCVTEAMDRYLLTEKLPVRGAVCRTGYQPFSVPLDGDGGGELRSTKPSRAATVLHEHLLRASAPRFAAAVRLS